jgi:hypothetical protein
MQHVHAYCFKPHAWQLPTLSKEKTPTKGRSSAKVRVKKLPSAARGLQPQWQTPRRAA